MPTISVIIPAYNAERTILATISSVQQQTFSDFELIIINDGSTDRTLELIQNIQDERLKIFSYENGGLPVARNRGISLASGEFIAFLDADDLWTPDKLELQLAALQQNPEAGVAYSWTYFMDEQGKSSIPGVSLFFEGDVQANLLVNNFLASGSNPLVRKQAIESVGDFDSNYKACEDWDYWLRLSADWNFVVVRKHQIFYRQSATSMSSTKVKNMEDNGLLVIEKTFQSVKPELQYLKNQSLAWIYQYSTQQYLKQNINNIEAVRHAREKLWQAIRLHPPILLANYAQDLIIWLIKKWILTKIYILRNKNKPLMIK
ncbi:Glycosyl transferase, family 2 [Trichormus variabilis ATCC 29413]|uniref:Glycosyl transferase, family 2 n=2 Tax=Anabaena variabilis TaxID=264691 RepID=Q3MEW9_TRIV2|nr:MULTISPECIES: glycosyltransferase [Nostocaceae]ABA20467.1 Glycosyl transferase, family 2 [Trichormus variabilis ATCC 29413]MBC1215808.1 glycosyltransferase [Trichormus variabilis ARAD]MBC1256856.1 glycosyltransferase [Trichormus variabilis V5]MBC1267986.1 glycosyltransferase [Trichormus variabilis FSR]MBC1304382.1 glycosyltransferase [Trichormus variabilis N2B]